jgi:hypothetical protein
MSLYIQGFFRDRQLVCTNTEMTQRLTEMWGYMRVLHANRPSNMFLKQESFVEAEETKVPCEYGRVENMKFA